MSKYKTIVLQQGLEDMAVDDYQFRKIKSLLRKKLNLTKKMQDDYDRIQMADKLEDTFPKDAGLNLLINVCQSIKELGDLAKRLKTERAKVKKQKKRKNKTAVKKGKQEETSSSQSLSTNNQSDKSKPSAQKKRKQTIKTEGGKKMKLTQEQTQLLEPSGSNPQKDECCLQTPHKPPTTPSSSSSNKKNTNIKKQSTIKTQVSQKKHQLPESAATSNSSAASKLQTLPEVSAAVAAAAAASNSLHQTSQTPTETCFTLRTSLGSPVPLCQNFPMSPASDSSIHLNSPVPLTRSSGVQAPHVPPATISGNSWVPHMPSKTVSSFLSTPYLSPGSVSNSAQNIHLPTAAAAGSKQSPQSPQVITSRPAQTPKGPSATLKRESQVGIAIASSNIQVPNALPEVVSRNDSTTQVSQRAAPSGIQTLNSATVKAPRNANVPGPLGTGHVYVLASSASPATASSSLQTSQVLLPTTSNSLPAPQGSIPIGTSKVQTTQTHLGASSNVIQALNAPPWTESRSMCTTQGPQGVSYGTGQAVPCSKEKASRSVHAPQMPSATASKSLLAPCGSPPTASSSLPDPWVSRTTASSALQTPLVPPTAVISSLPRTPKKGNLPKEPSKVEGHHREPKEVMVLKVTEPFTYDLIDGKRMFHATVATETEFFRVKVFETALKNKFIPKKIIAISDYFGTNGFLEIYGASCVSDENVNQTMVISNTLRRRANGTPKIKDLFSQIKGTYVNGEFMVTKKNERGDFIYYGIEDDTGKMEVVVYGRLTSINCEPGNKLRLVCFELTSTEDTWQLKSVRHSYMQVINARRRGTQP
ncbi:myeloid cell nuclear differentiation antigen-like protein isoform X1 [Peromyscus leucopus]|uniref:myeloid cell nuclear differentiation antigen-like protein isoform X1 n=1 Tax=Peromyscus leucopus TaxID=10041 RepID=UPI0010A15615|nr:myeloid cell nuclear differentiation antigen-like protein isoform X1 [Peromyscus leucopus]